MSNIKYFLVVFLFSITFCDDTCFERRGREKVYEHNDTAGPDIVNDLTCGKENPEKETDCTKYGTSSGLLCCWIAENPDSKTTKNGKCYLLPESKADSHYIEDCAQLKDGYWSCGNSSSYLKAISVLFVILIALL